MTAHQHAFCADGFSGNNFRPQSVGTSEVFQKVKEYMLSWEEHSSIPNSSRSHNKDISEIFSDITAGEYRSEDWDGEGADAIDLDTILIAHKVIELFDEGTPLPEIVPEPNGDIGMEWVTSSEHLVISISQDAGYTYAYISEDGDRYYGSGKIKKTGLPRKVTNLLPI